MSTVEDVIRHVNILHDIHSSREDKKMADIWLQDQIETPEAWSTAPQLLDGDFSEPALYHGALCLHSKIQHDFVDLPLEQHATLRETLFTFAIKYASGPSSVRNKLCLAIAALGIQMIDWEDVIGDVIKLLPLDHVGTLQCQLLVLTELPHEVGNSRLFVEYQRRRAIRTQLQDAAPQLLEHLVQCMQAAGSNTDIQAQVFGCLTALLQKCRFSLAAISDNPLLRAPFDAILEPALFDAALDLICELLRRSGKQLGRLSDDYEADDEGEEGEDDASAAERSGERAVAAQIVPLAVNLRDVFLSDAVNRDDEDVFAGYTRVFAELGEYYRSQFIVHGSPEALRIVEVLLQCASHPSTDVFPITARFWTLLAGEINEDEAKRELFAPAFAQLLDVVRGHVCYDRDYAALTKDRKDDFDKLRKDGMTAILRASADVLGGEAALAHACTAAEAALTALPNEPADDGWRYLEAALYCVRALARSVEDGMAQSHAAARAMALVPQLPAHQQVQYTGLLVVGRYAAWLDNDRNSESLPAVLQFVSQALTDRSTVAAASVALNNVCTACAARLVDEVAGLLSLYEHVLGAGTMLLDDAKEVMAGVASVVREMADDEQRCGALQQLCMPLAQQAAESGDETVVEFAVTLLADAFRYSARSRNEAPRSALSEVPPPDEDPLFGVLEGLWPLIMRLLEERVHDEPVLEVVCRFVRYTFRALPPQQVATLAPDALQRLHVAFTQRPLAVILHTGASVVCNVGRFGLLIDGATPLLAHAFEMTATADLLVSFADVCLEMFVLGGQLLDAAPLDFVDSELLPALLERACDALVCDQELAVRGVTAFLCQLFTLAAPRGKAAAHSSTRPIDAVADELRPRIMALLETHGLPLFDAAVTALASAWPPRYWGNMSTVLRRVRRFDGDALHALMTEVLSQRLPNLADEHKAAFVEALHNEKQDLYDACEMFGAACRRRKRWQH